MSDIYVREWPVADAKAGVVIAHGLAEHSGRYEYVANALNAAGYAVRAYDHRGHGQSVGFPGTMGDPGQVVADVVDQCVIMRSQHEKTFLLAHSMGTLFSLAAMPKVPEGTLTGLVLSGLATTPTEEAMSSMGSGGLPPETVSRDPEIVKAYVDDPLVFNDAVPDELMGNIFAVIGAAMEAIPHVTIPVLLIHGNADRLVSYEGSNMAYAELNVSDKTVRIYDGLYHEVLNEPERDTVIADVVKWLDAH